MDILHEKNVSFGIYNAYDEWGLVLEEYDISYPEQKKDFVEVPGKFDAYIDATYNLNDYPVFERRSGKFKFRIINGIIPPQFETWRSLCDDVAKKIHGKKMKISTYESPNYYYEGYITVSDDTLKGTAIGTIEVSADLYPYKKLTQESIYHMDKNGLRRFDFGRMPAEVKCSLNGSLTDDVNIIVKDLEKGTQESYSYNTYHSFNVWGSLYDIEVSGYNENDEFSFTLKWQKGEL